MKSATLIAIAVVEHGNAFLVGRRPDGTVLAGCWEFPGGKVGESEPPAAAAERECREETGLAVRALRLLHRRVHQYDHATVDLRFYECELVDERCEPTAPFGWVSRNQLRTLPFPEGNQDVLKLLVEGS